MPAPNNTEHKPSILKLALLLIKIEIANRQAKKAGRKDNIVIVGSYLIFVQSEKASIPIKCILQIPAENIAAAVNFARRS